MLKLYWVDAYYFPYRAKGNYTESKKKIDGNFKKNLEPEPSSFKTYIADPPSALAF